MVNDLVNSSLHEFIAKVTNAVKKSPRSQRKTPVTILSGATNRVTTGVTG